MHWVVEKPWSNCNDIILQVVFPTNIESYPLLLTEVNCLNLFYHIISMYQTESFIQIILRR